jgi:hypothetical protein
VAVRFVYEVYGFIDGGSRMVTASTLEQAKSITTREEKRTSFMDILLGIAVIVGILYGIGAL